MDRLWDCWRRVYASERRAAGTRSALTRLGAALRAVRFQRQHAELFGLRTFRRQVVIDAARDALFHLSHRHYLSKRFSARERVECVLCHYGFEDARYDTGYQSEVYGDEGLVLWSEAIDGVRYSIALRATRDVPCEGPSTLALRADGECLTAISFSWVDAKIFGAEPGPVPFITRNQSVGRTSPALIRFRKSFPHNSPYYFCLAATHGIAEAHQCQRIAAIRADAQLAFKPAYAQGFCNSYCDFWRSFGAVEIDHQAYVMPVPLLTPPLHSVKSKHRRRALDRRRRWWAIIESATRTLSAYRRMPFDRSRPGLSLRAG